MDNTELDNFRKLLLLSKEEVSNTMQICDHLKGEKTADEIDQAVADNNATLATKLHSRKSAYLKRIDTCLVKIDDGTYGECELCGDVISKKRLLVRPTALLCIHCKEDQEKDEQREKDRLRGGFLSDWE